MWSGDLFVLRAETGNDNWQFVIPESGGTLWSDNLMIPITSPHRQNAQTLMNYYYEPEVAAQVAAYVNYVCPVVGAQEELAKIDPELADEPVHLPQPRVHQGQQHPGLPGAHAGRGRQVQRQVAEGAGQLMAGSSEGGFREARGDLRLEDVTKAFGEFKAVDDLSLVVPRGSFFALLGPSGCGKTTTLRMVAGLEQPSSGRVLIGDTDLTGSRPYERPVNTVFQSYALFPHLTIRDNVAFGPKRRGQSDSAKLADDALSLVQMDHFATRKPTQLSGGQQQRVALARALVNRPEVLLLDEPLGALDLKLRRQMQVELKRIQTEVGLTFIHVTHDQEEAMTMADTVAVMNHGRIEQMGAPAEPVRPAAHLLRRQLRGPVQPRHRPHPRPRRRPRRRRGAGLEGQDPGGAHRRPRRRRHLRRAAREGARHAQPGRRRR